MRNDVNALWDEVTRYNREHPVPEDQQIRVYFDLGQGIEDSAADDAGEATEGER